MLARLILGLIVGIVQLGIAVVPLAKAQCPPGAQNCPNPSVGGSPSARSSDALPGHPADLPRAHNGKFPRPWCSAVRIKVAGPGNRSSVGSGTIVASSDTATVALTCAHIFGDAPPGSRPPAIVETFGQDLQTRGDLSFVPYVATFQAETLDFDRVRDVGLVVFAPPRPLRASPVVLNGYRPQRGEKLNTVGCSGGADASIWTTVCVETSVRMKNEAYQGFEARFEPPQGRSGGGCFTLEGRVAGVCNYADPNSRTGIYAAPESIHKILDRNQLLATAQRGGVSIDVGARPALTPPPTAPVSPQTDAPALPPVPSPNIPPSPYVPSGDPSRLGADLVELVTHPRTIGIAGLSAAAFAVWKSRVESKARTLQPAAFTAEPGTLLRAPASIESQLTTAANLLEKLVAQYEAEQAERARTAVNLARLRSVFPPPPVASPGVNPAPNVAAAAS